MADPNVSSYQPLQAPQQPQLGPLQVLQLLGQLQSNEIQKQELQSRQAIGNAYQQSTDPATGQIDFNKLRKAAPNVGFYAPEAVQQATANESAISDLDSKYQDAASRVIGELATHPAITSEDIARAKQRLAAQRVPGYAITSIFASAPSDQRGLKDWAVTHSNLARGPEAIAGGTTVPGPGGEPVAIPTGAASRIMSGGGLQTGMLPGANEAAAESQKSLVEDQKAAARTTANLRNLDIALPFAEKLSHGDFGPGSSDWAKGRAALITAGLIKPTENDPTVIRQELNKYMLKYATMAQNAGRSDQALSAAVGSNPNLDLTQPANLGLIKNQIGLDKMDAALPKIFNVEHPAAADRSQYNQYKSDYYDRFDRRVFSYDKLSPEERRTLVQSLGGKNSPAYKKFNQTYQLAKQAGVIVPDKQQ